MALLRVPGTAPGPRSPGDDEGSRWFGQQLQPLENGSCANNCAFGPLGVVTSPKFG